MDLSPNKIVAIASDHAGFGLKAVLDRKIRSYGLGVLDLGPMDDNSVDYPVYAGRLASALIAGEAVRGVAICGTGVGMSIVLNRTPGVRAAVCCSPDVAELARRHNDANILVLGARVMEEPVAIQCLDVFFETGFEGGRHARRIELIDKSGNSNI
ncbi:MAG: ribose 5-phosphate isomerase B [Rhodospirillaceae bacterium]|nr:ribose 5-phosphate isomerase B [Rhodospirillaceae bacterium]